MKTLSGGAPPPKGNPGGKAGAPVNQAKQVAQRNPIPWSTATQPCLSHLVFSQLDLAQHFLKNGTAEIFGGSPESVARAIRNAKACIGDALRMIEYDIAERDA